MESYMGVALVLFLSVMLLDQPISASDGCHVRYGRRSCHHDSVTGVVASCDGKGVEDTVPQNLPNDVVYLSLSNFKFRRLQFGNFSKFASIQCLSLKHSTELREIDPNTFSDLTQLKELKLEGTRLDVNQLGFLTRPAPGTAYRLIALSGTPSLQSAGNQLISDGSGQSPNPLESLLTLNFHGNHLTRFGNSALLGQLKSLEELDLSSNHLASLDWLHFADLTKLVHLSLRNNRFQTIPEQAADVFHALRELYLAENPLHCNCRLRWLREFYATAAAADKDLDFQDVVCMSPRRINMQWMSVDEFVCRAPQKPVVEIRQHGEKYVVQCSAVGDPAPTLRLLLADGRQVITPPSEDLSKNVTSSPEILTNGGGQMTCEATNSEGVVSTTVPMPAQVDLMTSSASRGVSATSLLATLLLASLACTIRNLIQFNSYIPSLLTLYFI